MRARTIAMIVLAAGWAAAVQAAPVELKDIPADALWMAHIDCDAARASKVTESFCRECRRLWPEAQEQVMRLGHRLGIMDRKNMHGITAYGVQYRLHTGVVIVRANVDKDVAMKELKELPDCVTWKYRNHDAHTWLMHCGTRFAHLVSVVFYKPDMVAIASSPDAMRLALDVLDGKSASLMGSETPLAAEVPKYAIFLARATQIDVGNNAKYCPVLQQVRRISYAEGQQGDRWLGNFTVVTESKAAAENVEEVFDGLRSLAALHFHGQPAVSDMLRNVKVSAHDETAVMTFEEAADKLAEQAPAICKAIHRRPMKRSKD